MRSSHRHDTPRSAPIPRTRDPSAATVVARRRRFLQGWTATLGPGRVGTSTPAGRPDCACQAEVAPASALPSNSPAQFCARLRQPHDGPLNPRAQVRAPVARARRGARAELSWWQPSRQTSRPHNDRLALMRAINATMGLAARLAAPGGVAAAASLNRCGACDSPLNLSGRCP